MADLFNFDFESGDFTGFTETSVDGGDLSVSEGAALHGAYGLSVLIDDTATLRASKTINPSANFRFRLYIDPNTLTMGDNETFVFAQSTVTVSPYINIVNVYLKYTSGVYYLNIYFKNDAGSTVLTDLVSITDASHCVEVNIVRATNDSSNDGSYEWWVDGVSQGSVASVDNYNILADQTYKCRVGVPEGGIDAGTSGEFYIDDFKANDDGNEIGQISEGVAIPVLLNQYRMRRE